MSSEMFPVIRLRSLECDTYSIILIKTQPTHCESTYMHTTPHHNSNTCTLFLSHNNSRATNPMRYHLIEPKACNRHCINLDIQMMFFLIREITIEIA